MTNLVNARRCSAFSAVMLATTVFAPSVAYAGFFDQLFGGGAGAPTTPSYSYEAPQSQAPEFGTPIKRPPIKKRVVVRDVAPVRQKTTDLMSDKTLHPGDAIMMADGLHIYSGAESAKHTARQFVPIDRFKAMSPKTRTLLAMETTRTELLKPNAGSDKLVSGRSAAVTATPISKGFRITDARGNSVRYVGP